MRKPFFAIESGMATAMTRALRHGERKSTCASTMVVTSSIELERMLLHSCDTSTMRPGMLSTTPSWDTGTPTAEKRTCAVNAEPCCKRVTTAFKSDDGNGTSQNKKQRGKSKVRAACDPRETIQVPIQKSSSANMRIESWTSRGRVEERTTAKMATRAAIVRNTEPARILGVDIPSREGHLREGDSRNIRAKLTGRINRMCVY